MRISASLPSYQQIEVDLPPVRTVKDLKRVICKKLDIEPELTKLLLRGKQLAENSKLGSIKYRNETIVVDYLWARHLLVWGAEGQGRIRSATILLAGAGAIGNETAKNLAMLGVGKILIIDRDRVELSNISRMVFFQPNDLGKNKAEVLAKNIHGKYPFIETAAYRGDLESVPLRFYLDADVVVCGLDNVVSRIFLSQTCRKYSVPLVDGGITGLNGRVHTYIPPDDACPICMFPPNQYAHIVGLRNPCEAPPEEEATPSFATSISLVSSILSQETIKIILGVKEFRAEGKWPEKTGQPLRSVLFVDMKNNRYTPIELKRSEQCFVCGKDGTAKENASRAQLPAQSLRVSRKIMERRIRDSLKIGEGKMTILLETAQGTRTLDGKTLQESAPGDYLRVLIEMHNGEFHESILKLT
ncbi:MAG TPA: ThiF family adenylyltransferase [Candidatus Acidoferrales bacterium]|nr:ThiF family adenylyltransferase [Candidatus Acidoferrales bacterium]